jgi:uncharacterized protein
MGLRFLLLIGASTGIALLLRNARHRRLEQQRSQGRPPRGSHPATMVRCARCGLHVPEPEAVRRGEDYYCCPEHADRGKTNDA